MTARPFCQWVTTGESIPATTVKLVYVWVYNMVCRRGICRSLTEYQTHEERRLIMSVTITTLDSDERNRWDTYVERSPGGTLFHRYGALEAQADATDSTLHPLVGYKGEEPVGIFPLFEFGKGPLTLVFSPPSELGVPNLGPALVHMDQLKQRKQEKRHRRFIEGCIEWIDDERGPNYVSIQTGWQYDDARPFLWNEFDVTPAYTYTIDLRDGKDAVISRFSKSARQNVRNNTDASYTISQGGQREIRWILDELHERYEEQGRAPPIPTTFIEELYDRLPGGTVRPYVLSVDGEKATGTVLLENGSIARSWVGGATPDVDIPANDLLEWHMMCDALDRGVSFFEIVGGNTPRLNKWKAKFSPDIQTYYRVKRSSPGGEVAENLYTTLRDRSSLVSRMGPAREV